MAHAGVRTAGSGLQTGTHNTVVESHQTRVADLLRFWNPEFLQHQLEHASVMDELPAVKV
jgi:hypothetical protein